MWNNLLFSVNSVFPFFLLILLGDLLRRREVLSQEFLTGANRFVYSAALPCSLFMSTASVQPEEGIDWVFLGILFLFLVGGFLVLWAVTELLFRDKAIIGTLVQGGFRGNYALLGIPMVTTVLGEAAAGQAALAMIAAIPAYNICSIIVLMLRGSGTEKPRPMGILKGILTSPLILSTFLGLLVAFLPFSVPVLAGQTLRYMGQTATPLALLAIGGLFRREDATARLRPALYAFSVKLVIYPLVVVAISYFLGYRDAELFILLVAAATPAAVSSYPMALLLGGDGPLAANILILSTLFSSLTLSAAIYVLRTLGWI